MRRRREAERTTIVNIVISSCIDVIQSPFPLTIEDSGAGLAQTIHWYGQYGHGSFYSQPVTNRLTYTSCSSMWLVVQFSDSYFCKFFSVTSFSINVLLSLSNKSDFGRPMWLISSVVQCLIQGKWRFSVLHHVIDLCSFNLIWCAL